MKYFLKKLHLSYLAGHWIRVCTNQNRSISIFKRSRPAAHHSGWVPDAPLEVTLETLGTNGLICSIINICLKYSDKNIQTVLICIRTLGTTDFWETNSLLNEFVYLWRRQKFKKGKRKLERLIAYKYSIFNSYKLYVYTLLLASKQVFLKPVLHSSQGKTTTSGWVCCLNP